MKEFIKNLIKDLAAGDRVSWALTLLLVCALIAAIGAGYRSLSSSWTDHQISNTQNAANTAVNQAVQSEANAANASIERKTEDSIREKVIRPKLDTARRNSEQSKSALEAAKRKYNEKTDPQTLDSSRADNCLRLQRDFPDTNFEYCSGQ